MSNAIVNRLISEFINLAKLGRERSVMLLVTHSYWEKRKVYIVVIP